MDLQVHYTFDPFELMCYCFYNITLNKNQTNRALSTPLQSWKSGSLISPAWFSDPATVGDLGSGTLELPRFQHNPQESIPVSNL